MRAYALIALVGLLAAHVQAKGASHGDVTRGNPLRAARGAGGRAPGRPRGRPLGRQIYKDCSAWGYRGVSADPSPRPSARAARVPHRWHAGGHTTPPPARPPAGPPTDIDAIAAMQAGGATRFVEMLKMTAIADAVRAAQGRGITQPVWASTGRPARQRAHLAAAPTRGSRPLAVPQPSPACPRCPHLRARSSPRRPLT